MQVSTVRTPNSVVALFPNRSVEYTYQRLYQAQANSAEKTAVPAHPRPAFIPSRSTCKQQGSLHNFWALPASQPVPDGVNLMNQPAVTQLKCDDCDNLLSQELGNAMEADVDGPTLFEFRCRGCRKNVCDRCAVVYADEGRECLQCTAGKKKWVGGLGWVPITCVC